MNIPQLIKQAHENAVEKGFYKTGCHYTHEFYDLVSHLKSEAREIKKAIPEAEKGFFTGNRMTSTIYNPNSFEAELSDIVIRVMSFCGHYGIDLEREIIEKMLYNKSRPHKHGKEY